MVHLVVLLVGLLVVVVVDVAEVVDGFFVEDDIHQGVSVVDGSDAGFCHQTVVGDVLVEEGGHQVVEVVGLFDHEGQVVDGIA